MQLKQNNKNFIIQFTIIFFANFCFFTSSACLLILPVHLQMLNASNLYIGLFMNVQALELIVIVFVYHLLIKYKRKQLLITGFILSIVSMIILSCFYKNLILLMILKTVSSVSYAFAYTLLFSMIYDILPPAKRKGGAAIYGIGGILSNPVGSLIGDYFYKTGNMNMIFIISAFFSLAALLFVLNINEKKECYNEEECKFNLFDIARDYRIFLLIIMSFIFGGVFGVYSSFLPAFGKIRISNPNISYFYMSFTIGAVALRFLMFKIFDRISSKLLIIFSFFMMFISLCLIIFINSAWQLILIGLLYGTGHTILFPTLSASFVNLSDEKNKLIYNNIFIGFHLLGTLLISGALGIVGDFFGLTSVYIIMGFIVLIFIICLFFLYNRLVYR
jgi:MFS family permease